MHKVQKHVSKQHIVEGGKCSHIVKESKKRVNTKFIRVVMLERRKWAGLGRGTEGITKVKTKKFFFLKKDGEWTRSFALSFFIP